MSAVDDGPEQPGLDGYLPLVLEVAGLRVAVAAAARVRKVMIDFANILMFGNECVCR